VKLLEKTNARYLTAEDLARAGAIGPVSFIAVDVSFISVHSFPAVLDAHFETIPAVRRDAVILIKPAV